MKSRSRFDNISLYEYGSQYYKLLRAMALYRQIQQFFDPIYSKQRRHISWGKLTVAIQKFQLLMQTQQKQLLDSLEEISTKKIDYLKSFIEYKQSVFQIKNKEEVRTMDPKRVGKFLQSGYEEIVTIFKYLKANPIILSNLLTHLPTQSSKFFPDLALNLVGLYNSPCFLYQQTHQNSQLSLFFDAILKDWKYSQNIEMSSIHSHIVFAIFKLPEPKRFIQNLYKKFDKEVLQDIIQPEKSIDCDKNRIKQEIRARMQKQKTKEKNEPKPSFLKRLFGKSNKREERNQDLGMSLQNFQNAENTNILNIQQERVGRLDIYLRKTLEIILEEQVPSICKFLASKFAQRLNSKQEIPIADLGNLLIKYWIGAEIRQKIKQTYGQKHPQIFRMIDFVQNIFSGCFQKVIIDERISFNSLLQQKTQEVKVYYKHILTDLNNLLKIQVLDSLVNFQRNLMFVSFRDVVIIVNLVKAMQQKKNLPDPLLSINLKFSQNSIYEPNNKILFDKKQYCNYNIYFCIPLESDQQYIAKSYLGSKTPLSDLPSISQTLLKSNIPVDDALKISSSLDFLKGVEAKLIVKAFEGFQTSNLHLPTGITELENILTLNKKSNEVLQNKSKFLYCKQMLIEQYSHYISITQKYITRMKAKYIYQKYVLDVIENMAINVYVSVDNQKIIIEEELPKQVKKLDIKLVLISRKVDTKQENVMNQILQNGMKKFQRVPRLLEALSKLDFTKKAFFKWQKAQQFNQYFKKLVSILHKVLDKNFKHQQSMIDLPTQKKMFNEAISKMLVKSIQKDRHLRQKQQKSIDHKFLQQIKQIDIEAFKQQQLKDAPIEDFAFQQAIRKFRGIDDKQSPQAKLAEFDMLIREIFKVISLSLPKQKITADVITPIVQYIVLRAQAKYTIRSACQIRCLCVEQSNYLMTLWRSALRYLKQYSKKKSQVTMSGTSVNSSGQDFLN